MAERIVGMRPNIGTPIDFPCEHDYHCPVCKYENVVNGNFDERLHWSEYEGFLWCDVCNKDYPTAICAPTPDEATKVYLATVRLAQGKTIADCVKILEGMKKEHEGWSGFRADYYDVLTTAIAKVKEMGK